MDELIQLILKTYGIVGLLILAPFVGLVVVWRENRTTMRTHTAELAAVHKQHALEMAASQDKVSTAQVQRVDDAQRISSKLMELASSTSALSAETNMALERLHETVTVLRNTKR